MQSLLVIGYGGMTFFTLWQLGNTHTYTHRERRGRELELEEGKRERHIL